jgi:hypothetical protein
VDWLFVLMLVAVMLILMMVRIWGLWLGQELDQREFANALTPDPSSRETRPPIILFLRSFDVAQVGLLRKFAADLQALLGVILSFVGDNPIPGPWARYDPEEELDEAIGNHCLFIALGDKYASYGSSKIIVDDSEWQRTFYELADSSALILMMPGPSVSVLWEISQILASNLLTKTVFIMPRAAAGERRVWAEFAAMAHRDLGLTVPRYSSDGRALWLQPDHHTWKTADLEGFTRTLGKYVKARPASPGREFDVEQVWQLL